MTKESASQGGLLLSGNQIVSVVDEPGFLYAVCAPILDPVDSRIIKKGASICYMLQAA